MHGVMFDLERSARAASCSGIKRGLGIIWLSLLAVVPTCASTGCLLCKRAVLISAHAQRDTAWPPRTNAAHAVANGVATEADERPAARPQGSRHVMAEGSESALCLRGADLLD